MKIRVEVRRVATGKQEFTVYLNNEDLNTTDVVCIIHHLCQYGKITSLNTSYPYETIKIIVSDKSVHLLFISLENDGYFVDLKRCHSPEAKMLTRKVTICKHDSTKTRLDIINDDSIFAEMSIDWEELEIIPCGTKIEMVLKYWEEDSSIVEELLKLVNF